MTTSPREEELYRERLAKLNRLRERGIDPYPTNFDRSHTSTDAKSLYRVWEAATGNRRHDAALSPLPDEVELSDVEFAFLHSLLLLGRCPEDLMLHQMENLEAGFEGNSDDLRQILRRVQKKLPKIHGKSPVIRNGAFYSLKFGLNPGMDKPFEAPVVKVAGRLSALRKMGGALFLDLQDGSASLSHPQPTNENKMQVFLSRDSTDAKDFEIAEQCTDLGDILGASGRLFRTKRGEITVQAESLTMLAKSLQTPPEKFHGLTDTEQRYRQRYRDLIANEETRDLFRLRSKVVSIIRRFLDGRGFIEVETPILTDQSGGAAARPFKTHHNVLDRDLYLRIATELHLKRLIVGGFDKVYEIGRIFRNEGLSWKHSPEYTMLESYEAYAGYEDVMRMLEEMISTVAQECLGTTRIEFADEQVELAPPWRRLPLRDALIEYADFDPEAYRDLESLKTRMLEMKLEPEAGAGWGKLIDQLQSEYVEPKLVQPTFLVDYPVELSPLAKQKPGDDHYVERFEAFITGFEVANAYSELNDPLEQRQRFIEQSRLREAGDDETESIDEDYLTALEHGMPPTGGLGLGIDRLVMLLSGRHNIREVILFPTLRERQ